MKLNIGIVGHPEGWESLLAQEGVPFARVTDDVTPDCHSAVVAGDDVHDRDLTLLRNYLSLGGGLLCSAKVYAELRQTTYNQEFIRYLLSDPTSHFSNVGLVDVQARCRVAWNANQMRTDRNSFGVHSGLFNNGHIIVLPFDASNLVHDNGTSLMSFYSPERRLPFEQVSTVSRGGIRKLVSRSLEILHHHRGIPYVHLWYYPRDAQSVFAFRVDTDSGRPSEIDELYRLVSSRGIPTSWFVDVKNQQLYLSMFAAMEHQEIGIHCFEHKIFDTGDQAVTDIRLAQRILADAGMKPEGFAAPFGVWRPSLARATQSCGFLYSSEFGYDYDNLPSFPHLGRDTSDVLQIPVHPISIGSLRRQGYSEERMMRYFDFIAGMKLAVRDPLIFYHHPKNGHLTVLSHLFEIVRSPRIVPMYFGEYAHWWKRRLKIRPRAEWSGSMLHVNAEHGPESCWLRISRPDGTEAFSPLLDELDTDQLSWELRPLPFALPPDYIRTRKFNYRIPLTKTVDAVARVFRGQVSVDVTKVRAKLP